jgi:hypothetical protein
VSKEPLAAKTAPPHRHAALASGLVPDDPNVKLSEIELRSAPVASKFGGRADHLLLDRLDVSVKSDVTVAELNSALRSVSATISGCMFPELSFTLAIPAQTPEEQLAAKKNLEATRLFHFVFVGRSGSTK